MAQSAIEKFIKDYIKNKKISESPEGYEAWLRKNGVNPVSDFSDKIARAKIDYERDASDYSAESEALAQSGLDGSGYAKFLEGEMKEREAVGIENAIRSYIATDSENRAGYEREAEKQEQIRLAKEKKAEEERLKAEKKKQEEERLAAEKAAAEEKKKQEQLKKEEESQKKKLYENAKSSLEKSGIIDYNKAYSYLIEMGLDEKNAESVARTTTEIARSKAMTKVTEAIISKGLTMSQAREYALGLGLCEADAETLAELAFKANESVGDITSYKEYLDYLKNKANKNN